MAAGVFLFLLFFSTLSSIIKTVGCRGMTNWVYLFIAGLMEVCWAIGLKYTKGFSQLGASVFTLLTLVLSMFFLAKAVETLPLSTAYSIWVGIGVVGTSIFGVVLFSESMSASKLFFIVLLVISIFGLKLTHQG